jgi:hypothetical protein
MRNVRPASCEVALRIGELIQTELASLAFRRTGIWLSRRRRNSGAVLGGPRCHRRNETLTLIFFIVSLLTLLSAHLSFAAEQDPRMAAPPNAISGKLPGIAP